jgi:hypothetical protein
MILFAGAIPPFRTVIVSAGYEESLKERFTKR